MICPVCKESMIYDVDKSKRRKIKRCLRCGKICKEGSCAIPIAPMRPTGEVAAT
jgi:hypothetical protein